MRILIGIPMAKTHFARTRLLIPTINQIQVSRASKVKLEKTDSVAVMLLISKNYKEDKQHFKTDK